MKCPKCGFKNDDDSIFCIRCGIIIKCPHCSCVIQQPDAVFCPKCGAMLHASTAGPAARNATVSMGDKNVIVGDTTGGVSPAVVSAGGTGAGVSMGDKNVIAGDVNGMKVDVANGGRH